MTSAGPLAEASSRVPWSRRDGLALAVVLLLPVMLLRHAAGGLYPIAAGELLESRPFSGYLGDRPPAGNRINSDTILMYYPHDAFLNGALKRGTLPLWNPLSFSGQPIAGSVQVALFYPPRLLAHRILPPAQARTLLILFHLTLTGAAMLLFLGLLGVSPWARLCGACSWMFCGHSTVWLEWDNFFAASAYLPVTLALLELALRRRSWLLTGVAGAASGLAFLAGQAQPTGYCCLLCWAYLVARSLASRRSVRSTVAALALHAAVTGLVAAPVLLPALDQLARNQRAPFTFAQIQDRGLSPEYLLTLVFPTLFGCHVDGHFYGGRVSHSYRNFTEFAAYVGAVPLGLALLAVFAVRRRAVWFFAAVAILAMLGAMGTVVYWPVWYLLPGYSRMVPTRILVLWAFSLCALAGLGLDGLARLRPGRAKACAVVLVTAALGLAVLLACGDLAPGLPRFLLFKLCARYGIFDPTVEDATARMLAAFRISNPAFLLPVLGVMGLGLASWLCARPARWTGRPAAQLGLTLLAVAQLVQLSHLYNPAFRARQLYPPLPAVDFLRAQPGPFRVVATGCFPTSSLRPYDLEDARGYDSVFPATYADLTRCVNGRDVYNRAEFLDLESPLLDLLGVRFVISPITLRSGRFRLVHDDSVVRVHENPGAFPRAWVVHESSVEPDAARRARVVASARVDLARCVVLEEPATCPLTTRSPAESGSVPETGGPARPCSRPVAAGVTPVDENEFVVTARLDRPGFVVVAVNHDPGWHALARGGELPVLRADHSFMAVRLEAGAHEIRFRHRPAAVVLGLVLAALGLLAIGLLALAGSTGRTAAAPDSGPPCRRSGGSQEGPPSSGPSSPR